MAAERRFKCEKVRGTKTQHDLKVSQHIVLCGDVLAFFCKVNPWVDTVFVCFDESPQLRTVTYTQVTCAQCSQTIRNHGLLVISVVASTSPIVFS